MYLFYNQKYYPSTQPIIATDSKAFRYGILAFETIKYTQLYTYFIAEHYTRLCTAAQQIGITIPITFTPNYLSKQITALAQKNKLKAARIRVTVWGGNGGLYDNTNNTSNLLIESYALPTDAYELNSNGLQLALYTKQAKQYNELSRYKHGNYLLYQLAANYAKQQQCNEAIVLNEKGNVCDCTISNIFIWINNTLITPSLSSGCVAGIMRNYLLRQCPLIQEKEITINDLNNATSIFVTNVIKGVQWVKNYEENSYTIQPTSELYYQYIAPLNNTITTVL